jgi:hypothetical protein
MADVNAAVAQLALIEQAVANQDLVAAELAVKQLRPMLVQDQVESLLSLRSRLSNLQLEVRQQRADAADQLKQMRRQRGGSAAYSEIAQKRG